LPDGFGVGVEEEVDVGIDERGNEDEMTKVQLQ